MNHDDELPEDRDSGTPNNGYEVGYGKPPASGRFKKGKSGNPRGRPKKKTPTKYDLSDVTTDVFIQEELLHRHVTVWENGVGTQLPVAQALRRSLIVSGLKGNRLAAQQSLQELEKKEDKHFQIKLDRFKRYVDLKRDGERRLAEHKNQNLPPPTLYPHPDDIELVPRTGDVIIHGPESVEEANKWEYWAKLRDYIMLNAARKCGGANFTKIEDDKTYLHIGAFLAFFIDKDVMPRRYRWQNEYAPIELVYQSAGPKREWTKFIAAKKSWLDANHHIKATEHMPADVAALFKEALHAGAAHGWVPVGIPATGIPSNF